MIPVKIFVVCSGLGNINRGYESFFRGLFNSLQGNTALDMTLFKGGGESAGREVRLWNTPRSGRRARWLAKPLGRSGYFSEQFTFFLAFLPHLVRDKPDLVYVSDVVLANLIRLWKKWAGGDFAILFNNNGPVRADLLHRWDHIQQVSPEHFQSGLTAGVPGQKQTLLPSAIEISQAFAPCRGREQEMLRKRLKLPARRAIVLSIGSLSKSRKRMDYLIREVAALSGPRPFLLLLGAPAVDTHEVVALGHRLLSDSGFCALTVGREEVADYCKAADVFALASLDEGFGLAYIEALSHGLPCLAHDYATARFALGELGYYGDLRERAGLTKLMSLVLAADCEVDQARARHAYAYERFSWDRLTPRYLELFESSIGNAGKQR